MRYFVGIPILFLLQSCGYQPSSEEIQAREDASTLVMGLFDRLPPIPQAWPSLEYGNSNVRMTGNYRENSANIEAAYFSDESGERICSVLLDSMDKLPDFSRKDHRNNLAGCKPTIIGQPHNYHLYGFSFHGIPINNANIRSIRVSIRDYLHATSAVNNGHRTHVELSIYKRKHNPACTMPDDKPWPCDPARWFQRRESDPD
jgi:hypothetical protein